MQDGQFVETVKMLALLCMVGKAKGAGKGWLNFCGKRTRQHQNLSAMSIML